MLVTLSMVFCLVSDPTQCQTINPLVPDDQPMTLSSCQVAGQIEGAKWVNEHPKHRLARVRCTLGKRTPERVV